MQHSSPKRPQLTDEQAALFHYLEVMKYTGPAGAERVDPWDPLDDAVMRSEVPSQPDYTVIADGTVGGIQRVIDLAITDAKANARTDRISIEISKGTHTGLVYVPALEVNGIQVPISLFGAGANPDDVLIVEDIDAEMSAKEYSEMFSPQLAGLGEDIATIFNRIAGRSGIITTANASVVRVENAGFQMRNLSVKNTYAASRVPEGVDPSSVPRNAEGQITKGQHQAVAVLIAGADKVHLDLVNLSSFQDTLYFQAPAPAVTARSFYSHCYIEGDVDFIFGQSTAYFWKCEIKSRGSRAQEVWATAPSTNIRTKYGIVFDDCDFTHDQSPNALSGTFNLGRQWFEGVRCTPYGVSPVEGYSCVLGEVSQYDDPTGTISQATLESVGKCVVMNSRLGAHINKAAPWCDWNGGTFTPDGTFTKGPWNPRYRPAQFCVQDFLDNLIGWSAVGALDHSDLDPEGVFLAEYKNVDGTL